MSEVGRWREASLADLAEYINGYAFKPEDWSEHGLPIVRIAQITGSSEDWDFFAGALSETFKINHGDLIFSWSGTLAVVRWPGGPAWLNQHLFRVDPATGVDGGFLFHLLQVCVAEMDKRAHGSTMKHIKRGELRDYRIRIPQSVREQQKIAQILDTLDTQIRQTEALIAKLEQIKQGLLTDLLTRGIDEHGQLRPPPKEAPHLYKDSPLGRIPNEWVCLPLGEVVPSADYGISSSLSGSGQVPVLRMNNLSKGEADLSDLKFAPRQAVGDLLLKPGDVLFNRTNSIEHVGRTGIWRGQIEVASFASYLVRLNNEPTRLIAEFLNIWLNFGYTQLRLRRFATPGVHQVNVNPTNLRRVLIALPGDIEEQRGIVTVLEAEDERLEAERRHQSKLVGQKSALLEDLLSGRVRVAPLLHGVEHAPS